MLKQVFKLTADQYEKFYLGEDVFSSDTHNKLKLNSDLSVTINDTVIVEKKEYIVEISNKYVSSEDVEALFTDENIDVIATANDVRNLFN